MAVRTNKRRSRGMVLGLALLVIVIIAGTLWLVNDNLRLLPQRCYTADHFDIATLSAATDFDADGIDDYQDILLGARADALNHPRYHSAYYEDAYPPDDIGVCTDVVWRAFRDAGYDLRMMVDADIAQRPQDYPGVESRDNNIDFRRVGNLLVFFDRYAEELTTDIDDIAQWQPGDIVIFGGDKHIGIVSDRRNKEGRSFIIHNGGQLWREEDYLSRGKLKVTAHYRFDAAAIDEDVLLPWSD